MSADQFLAVNRGLTGHAQIESVGNGKMKRQSTMPIVSESVGQRLAGPAMVLGSLFAIALMLYAVDATSLRDLLF
jgi:hypothetical protein